MYKFIVIALLALIACDSAGNEVSENKQSLITQAQQWVSQQTGVTAEQVNINAMDRRLKVPHCEDSFSIAFAYKANQNTIRITCEKLNWQVFVGVKVIKNIVGLSYARAIGMGETISADDVIPAELPALTKGFVTEVSSLIGKNLTKSVASGEPVMHQHLTENILVFKLSRDLLAGELIGLANVVEIKQPKHLTSKARRLPGKLLETATVAKDLRAGTVLSRHNIRIKQSAMLATKMIPQGQKLSLSNAKISDYFGDLPSDIVLSYSGINQMEALRTLRAGQLIRASDLRPTAMIRKGDNVTLNVGKNALTVSIPLIALEDGMLNEQITLLNPSSNKKVRARVSGPGEARGL